MPNREQFGSAYFFFMESVCTVCFLRKERFLGQGGVIEYIAFIFMFLG